MRMYAFMTRSALGWKPFLYASRCMSSKTDQTQCPKTSAAFGAFSYEYTRTVFMLFLPVRLPISDRGRCPEGWLSQTDFGQDEGWDGRIVPGNEMHEIERYAHHGDCRATLHSTESSNAATGTKVAKSTHIPLPLPPACLPSGRAGGRVTLH